MKTEKIIYNVYQNNRIDSFLNIEDMELFVINAINNGIKITAIGGMSELNKRFAFHYKVEPGRSIYRILSMLIDEGVNPY